MNPRRGAALAAVCASAVLAGIMASSNGRETVASALRRNVLLGRCFLVRYMAFSSSLPLLAGTHEGAVFRHRHHLELIAGNDAGDDCGKMVTLSFCLVHDAAHGWHVVAFHGAANGVHQQLFREDV